MREQNIQVENQCEEKKNQIEKEISTREVY